MRQNEIWENIVVPNEMENVIKSAVNIGYQEVKTYKEKNWLNIAITIGGMAAALTLFVGAGFLSPMIANAYTGIQVIGKIFSYLYELEEYDVKYEQIAESAEPIVSIPKEEYVEEEILADASTQVQESGVDIELQEAYCDGYSLYLSVQVVSDTPFFDESTENKEGMIQIFASENITTSNGQNVEIGDGSLNLQGVFTDTNTFVGVARSGETLEDYNLPEEVEYTITSKHIKVYAGEEVTDVRGQWEYRGMFKCTTEALTAIDVEESIADGFMLQEIRLQPYEIQAVIAEPLNGSLAEQCLCIEAFDENGNRLSLASNSAARFSRMEDSQLEIWMFERPENVQRVTLYVLDEIKWLDDWKGYLYSENPWTGEQMMEFLENNCVASVEVDVK